MRDRRSTQTPAARSRAPNRGSWSPEPCKGFEHYAASLAARTITELNIDMFTEVEVFELVHKMWRVKADVKLPHARTSATTRTPTRSSRRWRTSSIHVQETQPAYTEGMAALPEVERNARGANLDALLNKSLPKATKKLSLHVVPRIANLGFRQAAAVPVVMYRGVGQQTGTRVKPKSGAAAITVTLAGGEVIFRGRRRRRRTRR